MLLTFSLSYPLTQSCAAPSPVFRIALPVSWKSMGDLTRTLTLAYYFLTVLHSYNRRFSFFTGPCIV